MEKNPIIGFQVDPDQIRYIGNDLQRPECILAEPNGTLWAADARGGVVSISPEGKQRIITQSFDATFIEASDDASRFTEGTLPNFSVSRPWASHGSLALAYAISSESCTCEFSEA